MCCKDACKNDSKQSRPKGRPGRYKEDRCVDKEDRCIEKATRRNTENQKLVKRAILTRTFSVWWNKFIERLKFSRMAMSIVSSFINDMFARIATEASQISKYNKRKSLSSREIQTAVRLLLPGELGQTRHQWGNEGGQQVHKLKVRRERRRSAGIPAPSEEGNKAVIRYTGSKWGGNEGFY